MDDIDAIVEKLVSAGWKQRDAVRSELLTVARTHHDPTTVIDHLEASKRRIDDLEIRWEIDDVIEALTPPPAPEPEPEPDEEEDDPDRPLSASDLDLVYDDPRGLMLHRGKKGDRWFLTQVDPYTRQPVTQEIPASQIPAMKAQLKGSPYWLLGSGMM